METRHAYAGAVNEGQTAALPENCGLAPPNGKKNLHPDHGQAKLQTQSQSVATPVRVNLLNVPICI